MVCYFTFVDFSCFVFFFFKQKTAYEMRISDWSSDVCSSDLHAGRFGLNTRRIVAVGHSAGAHLALWLTARPKLPETSPLAGGDPLRIDHVVALGGLPDLEAVAASPDNGCGTDVVARLVGPEQAVHPDRYAATSVPRLLPPAAAHDLAHGDGDCILPPRPGT